MYEQIIQIENISVFFHEEWGFVLILFYLSGVVSEWGFCLIGFGLSGVLPSAVLPTFVTLCTLFGSACVNVL